jgi:hypothetical protein
MTIMKKLSFGAVLAFLFYWVGKLIWTMFWGFLFSIIKTLVMVGIVATALYVLWSILGNKPTGERD